MFNCIFNMFRSSVILSLMIVLDVNMFFFFKQKTAYEMRISDWSSDVCSSDLSLVNQYAAFPSLHLGWNLLIAITLYQSTRVPLLKIFEIGRASCRERVCQYV